jgi:eukaryotic-like serine/threonine-protein kinase
MAATDRCPDCGSERSAGVCPRCMIRLGLDAPGVGLSGGGPSITLARKTGELDASVLDTIAASVGSVPRVLLRDTDTGFEPPLIKPARDAGGDGTLRYRIDGEIARGGMGSVLKGRDPDLGRDVAVKVLREDLRDNPEMVRRFVEEAQIGGQLQHPGVVPIYELGTFADRRPFFSMKLVKGHTLAVLLESRKQPVDELPRFIGIFEQVAQTVAYAHARGVIHRDLKPSNVMVGAFGEVQVMDWGLAKVLSRGGTADDAQAGKTRYAQTVIATARSGSDDPDLSHVGSVMGTPAYMAPEQARGEVGEVDERADVFALGSILCEILTGEPAFTGRSSGEIHRKAALGDTADAVSRLAVCGADSELVKLANECLTREAEDRPRDASAVAESVSAYLSGVQEKLRRAELARVEERGRRRLTTVAAAAVIVLTLAAGGSAFWIQQQKAERLAKTARGVDEAMAEAARLRGEAQAAPADDDARWGEAVAAAKRALALATQGEPDAPLRTRVAALLSQLDHERAAAREKAAAVAADRTLLSELQSIRDSRGDHGDSKRTDAEYTAALYKAGLDVDANVPEQAAHWIAIRSDPIELAGYLDDWAYVRRLVKDSKADWRPIVALARAADRDPWRDRLREKTGTKDEGAKDLFRRLADDMTALDAQPATSLVLLARQLRYGAGDRDRAATVLRRAVPWRLLGSLRTGQGARCRIRFNKSDISRFGGCGTTTHGGGGDSSRQRFHAHPARQCPA